MDLYVERQAIEEMQAGDKKKFLLLFDACFEDLYRYVARRVKDLSERERIVRASFLDALGQVQNTPKDVSYLVFLYGLARPRAAQWVAQQPVVPAAQDDQFGKMMGKLSLEEREILRLKFFEQVTDGDVMVVLGAEEGTVGQKIYRVLKRAHFLLFGEAEKPQGVYFGELSGFFERARMNEELGNPDVLKLSLRTDLTNRLEREDFAMEGDAEVVSDAPFTVQEEHEEVVERVASSAKAVGATGSDDPAKIFVEAVKEMREEEAQAAALEMDREREDFERREKIVDFFDRWKLALAMIPVALFMIIVSVVLFNVLDFRGEVERGYATTCGIEVQFEGDFSDHEQRLVHEGVSSKLCDKFDVQRLLISRTEYGVVAVEVDVPDWMMEYKFVLKEYKKKKNWRIKDYVRTLSSNEQPGEVS